VEGNRIVPAPSSAPRHPVLDYPEIYLRMGSQASGGTVAVDPFSLSPKQFQKLCEMVAKQVFRSVEEEINWAFRKGPD
jgi:hypothetical protein